MLACRWRLRDTEELILPKLAEPPKGEVRRTLSQRLSEKEYEQRSERALVGYTEAKKY